MENLTIKDLYQECREQIKRGNGDKKVLITRDDECNGLHGLWYGFTPTTDFQGCDYMFPHHVGKPDEYIVLG